MIKLGYPFDKETNSIKEIDSKYCDTIIKYINTAYDEEAFVGLLKGETMSDLNRVLWLIVYRLWKRMEAK